MGQQERRFEVVTEYEKGGVSLRDLEEKFRVSSSTIHRWIKEAEAGGGMAEWERLRVRGELTAKQSKALPKEVRKLQKELEEARFYNDLLNAMIDIAEEQMGIDIRKNLEPSGDDRTRDRQRAGPESHLPAAWLKSDPLENAIAERVNGILKDELLEKRYDTFKDARDGIDEAVNIYNHHRPHLSIEMPTPAEAHLRTGTLKRLWKTYYSTQPIAQAAA